MSEIAIELHALPELEEIPRSRDFEVLARLKKSSKYHHQGLVDPTDSKSERQFFKLESFTPGSFGQALSLDSYSLRFNNNQYRIEDCELFLRDAANPKWLLRIR
jgi:hypothetical protein